MCYNVPEAARRASPVHFLFFESCHFDLLLRVSLAACRGGQEAEFASCAHVVLNVVAHKIYVLGFERFAFLREKRGEHLGFEHARKTDSSRAPSR
jgi:hypothetical protein